MGEREDDRDKREADHEQDGKPPAPQEHLAAQDALLTKLVEGAAK